jgi:hypothetical protein
MSDGWMGCGADINKAGGWLMHAWRLCLAAKAGAQQVCALLGHTTPHHTDDRIESIKQRRAGAGGGGGGHAIQCKYYW